MWCVLLFFFFKQKTAYEMRISDWSSDVCSSDLRDACGQTQEEPEEVRPSAPGQGSDVVVLAPFECRLLAAYRIAQRANSPSARSGRARRSDTDRKSVV